MLSSLKEKFLLYRVRAKNDPEAFGEVYDTYSRQIYRFIYFKVSSAELAEDLTSDTFLKAWKYLKEKREVPNLQALLYTVARTVVIDYYRKAAKECNNLSLDEAIASETTEIGSEKLIHDIETNMDLEKVMEKLWGLKDDYREVITMKFLDQLSIAEIATALGKSPAAVRVLVHRATKALTEALEENDRQATQQPAGTSSK